MSARRKLAPSRIVQQPAAQFYDRFVESIKQRIRTAQIKAALAANAQLVLHYWEIARDILASQKREGGARRSSTVSLLMDELSLILAA